MRIGPPVFRLELFYDSEKVSILAFIARSLFLTDFHEFWRSLDVTAIIRVNCGKPLKHSLIHTTYIKISYDYEIYFLGNILHLERNTKKHLNL